MWISMFNVHRVHLIVSFLFLSLIALMVWISTKRFQVTVINPPLSGTIYSMGSEPLVRYKENGLWGFRSLSGVRVPAKFKHCAPMFKEGLAWAMDTGTQKYGYIDITGTFVIAPTYDLACDFSEGLA